MQLADDMSCTSTHTVTMDRRMLLLLIDARCFSVLLQQFLMLNKFSSLRA